LSPKCFEPLGFIFREKVVCAVMVCFTAHIDVSKTHQNCTCNCPPEDELKKFETCRRKQKLKTWILI